MKRMLIGFATLALAAGACTAGGSSQPSVPPSLNPSASHDPVTITMWTEWTSKREAEQFSKIFEGFQQKYPWITVNSVKGLTDDKILAAISAGNPPDALLSFGVDNVPKFCDSGAWIDLNPYIAASKMDKSQFPPSIFQYTGYNGNQCSLPFLTDAYGLYYNKDQLEAAGYTEPPKTTSELTAMAKKLTVFNPDGSIKVAGFVPWMSFYEVNSVTMGVPWNGQYYNADLTQSALATDPAWTNMLTWQKELVDFYGADNLAKFVAGAGEEFSTDQAFETGKIAMNLDGEWRTAFIADEVPDLNYGTAPMPVPDDQADRYGVGQIGGTVIGIPKGAAHPDEAWLLVQYMATDTATLVYMANTVGNVPTTYASLQSPDLVVTPQFQTFLDIFENPGSYYKGNTPIGIADQNTFSLFLQKWQSGQVTDLQAGLEATAKQIDDQLAQAGIG